MADFNGALGLIMTQICAYKVSFSSLCRLSLCRDFCMKQRLFPRVRPNDPFTFNTSVATSTTTLPKKLSRFFHQKEDHLHKIWKLWSTASNLRRMVAKYVIVRLYLHIVWKLLKMSHSNFGIFHQFCPIKIDLSGSTIWPQASGFQKLPKMDHFWHF